MNRYHILLVDDEELALAGIESGVSWSSLGIDTVYKADSMKMALQVIETRHVDLMICDIEMPGGSGLELIRRVREAHPDILCIFYTCHAEFSYCQEAIRLGAMDYVLKPIPYKELEEILHTGIMRLNQEREAKGIQDIWKEITYKESDSSAVQQAQKYIAEHLTEELSREELAKMVYVSPDYLTKLFKKETGMPLNEYIISKRIQLAKQLLSETDLTIVEITEKAGFSYSSYFVKIFKKKTGMTPQRYRDEHRKQ